MEEHILEIMERQRKEVESILSQDFVEREAKIGERELGSSLVKVVIGPRRAGKSFFALQTVRDSGFAYLNFDEEGLGGVGDYDIFMKHLREVYGDFKLAVFDEVQNLPRWELFVNRLQRSGHNMIVTGSNSNLLSRELATHLTGRHTLTTVLQFSFREFLRAGGMKPRQEGIVLKETQGEILRKLKEYMEMGGFPEVIVKELDYRDYAKTLFNSIIFKDVVKRYNVRFSSKISDLGRYMINLFSKELSFTKAKNMLGLGSTHTVEKYTRYLEEAFLIIPLSKFSFKAGEQIASQKKIYIMDSSFINSMGFRISENFGRLMENTVLIELARRSSLFSDFEVFYWKDYQQHEVDFILKENLKTSQLIQVTYASGRDEIEKREIRALLKASEELRCKDLLVITWDYEAEEKIKGRKISFIPLWKWLLSSPKQNCQKEPFS